MRIVMSGDKSKYHFFRSIVDLNKSKNQEIFFTERLGERDVILTSDLYKTGDNAFYSSRIPLNTELYFPSEYSDLSSIIKKDDKVIFFDEFPYATDKDIKKFKEILDSGKAGQVVVVLFQSFRENLETDISTDDMALEDAEGRYKQSNVSVYKYLPNSFPAFLLWENDIDSAACDREFFFNMELVKQYLDTFDSGYEYMFGCPDENGQSMASLIDFDILASFCKYDRKLKSNNVWKIYHDKAYKFYRTKDYIIKYFCKVIYEEALGEICIWDFEIDFDKLYSTIMIEFEKIIDDIEVLAYNGSEADYDEFLKEYQEEIVSYKEKIRGFFTDTMKKLIKDRVHRNILRLEVLFS